MMGYWFLPRNTLISFFFGVQEDTATCWPSMLFHTKVKRQIVAIGSPKGQTTRKPRLLLDPILFNLPELTIRKK